LPDFLLDSVYSGLGINFYELPEVEGVLGRGGSVGEVREAVESWSCVEFRKRGTRNQEEESRGWRDKGG
jgi:hypothetical protein